MGDRITRLEWFCRSEPGALRRADGSIKDQLIQGPIEGLGRRLLQLGWIRAPGVGGSPPRAGGCGGVGGGRSAGWLPLVVGCRGQERLRQLLLRQDQGAPIRETRPSASSGRGSRRDTVPEMDLAGS